MDDLWQRVEQLVGQKLPLVNGAGRTVQVLAVDADTVFLRGERRDRMFAEPVAHQIPRADIEAAARLGLHGTALQIAPLLRRRSDLHQPGYILALLRALEADEAHPAP